MALVYACTSSFSTQKPMMVSLVWRPEVDASLRMVGTKSNFRNKLVGALDAVQCQCLFFDGFWSTFCFRMLDPFNI